MDINDTPVSIPDAAENMDRAHREFQALYTAVISDLVDSLQEPMLDLACDGHTITREAVIGQILMNLLGDYEDRDNPDLYSGAISPDQKVVLTKIANQMGPDWAQALYHAAVFITKVA